MSPILRTPKPEMLDGKWHIWLLHASPDNSQKKLNEHCTEEALFNQNFDPS